MIRVVFVHAFEASHVRYRKGEGTLADAEFSPGDHGVIVFTLGDNYPVLVPCEFVRFWAGKEADRITFDAIADSSRLI